MIQFKCECGAEFEAKENRAGGLFECPKCAKKIRVPKPRINCETPVKLKSGDDLSASIAGGMRDESASASTSEQKDLDVKAVATKGLLARRVVLGLGIAFAAYISLGLAILMFSMILTVVNSRHTLELDASKKIWDDEYRHALDKRVKSGNKMRELSSILEAAGTLNPTPTAMQLAPIRRKLKDAEVEHAKLDLKCKQCSYKLELATNRPESIDQKVLLTLAKVVDRSLSDKFRVDLAPPDDLTVEEAVAASHFFSEDIRRHQRLLSVFYTALQEAASNRLAAERLEQELKK